MNTGVVALCTVLRQWPQKVQEMATFSTFQNKKPESIQANNLF
jgi:uncharacterized membrane protein YesL